MDVQEIIVFVVAGLAIAALLLFPRWFSFRHRAIAGVALLLIGLIGVFGGLVLGDTPSMQSEAVAWIWVTTSALAILLAITLVVPVFFEWRRKRRKPTYKVENWRAGHRKTDK